MKRRVALGGATLGGLLVLLVVNAWRVPASQPTGGAPVDLRVDVHRAAARLGGAIRARTVSNQDPSKDDPVARVQLREHLRASFPRVHAALACEVVGEGNLLFTWKGRGPGPATVLMGHLDVVPVDPATEPRWTVPPFEGRVDEGWVWGRGAIDDKGGVIMVLEAVETLLERGFVPAADVHLAFGHDEEVFGLGAPALRDLLLARGAKPALVLDEGLPVADGMIPGVAAPVAVLGVQEKGYLTVELRVEMDGGHSSLPAREGALGVLARALSRLQDNPMPLHQGGVTLDALSILSPEMSVPWRLVLGNPWLFGPVVRRVLARKPSTAALLRSTTAPTVFAAGVKENVVPSVATALVNFRIHPLDTVQDVLAHVAGTVDDSRVTVRTLGTPRAASPRAPLDGRGYALLAQAMRKVEPAMLVAPGLVVGATDARHWSGVTAEVFRFRPVRLAPADLPRIHGVDERLALADLERGIRFYAQVLVDLAAGAL